MDGSRKRCFGILLLILALAAIGRIAAVRGFSASDDADYAQVAWEICQGRFPPPGEGVPPHYPSRLGVALPAALCFKLFGVHEWSLLLFPILSSAASIALAYFLGRVFFCPRAGLIAAALYAIVPIDCRFATWLLSDVPGSFWAGAAVLALWLGSRATGAPRKALAGLAAAACLGVSWVTRTQVAHLVPFIAGVLVAWCWRDRRNLWLAVPAAAGALLFFCAEGFFYLQTRGDFFHVFNAAEKTYEAHARWYYFKEGGAYGYEPGQYALGLARRLLKHGPAALFLNANFALLPLMALIGVCHAAFWRRGEFLFPSLWFLWAAFAFNFGSASLRRYEPLPWVDAYVVPVLLPAVAVCGGWLELMSRKEQTADDLRRERRFWAAGCCLAIGLAAAFGLYQHWRQGIGCRETRPAARWLARAPKAEVYSDRMTIRGLRFFWGYRELMPLKDFSGLRSEQIPTGALVLVNPAEIRRMQDQVEYVPPEWVRHPPADWRVAMKWGEATLYEVGPAGARRGEVR